MKQRTAIQKLFIAAVYGFVISFLGSLPLGTMNIAATHIAIEQGTHAGLVYAAGSMLVEIAVVRIALVSMSWLAKRRSLFQALEFFTTALILVLAITSFVAAWRMTGFSGSIKIGKNLPPFWTGVILSITNPLHIPFWLGWSTVLLNKKVLLPNAGYYNWYMIGIATGTLLGFSVFIYGGTYMVAQITRHQDLLNLVIGIVLLVTALLQVKKMIHVPAAMRYSAMDGDHSDRS